MGPITRDYSIGYRKYEYMAALNQDTRRDTRGGTRTFYEVNQAQYYVILR
jgi:hypothetical protein